VSEALSPCVAGRPLPLRPPPNLHGVVLGDALHLFGGPPNRTATHLALDADGQVVADPHDTGLPAVHDATRFGADALVSCTGSRDGASVPVLAVVAAGGAVRWHYDLPAPGGVAQWARVAAGGRAVWAVDRPARYLSGTVAAGPAVVYEPEIAPEPAIALAAAAAGSRTFLATVLEDRLVIRLLDGGTVRAERELPEAVFARVAAVPDGWLLLCLVRETRTMTLTRMDPDLRETGHTGLEFPAEVFDAWLVVDDHDQEALRVRLAGPRGRRSAMRDLVAPVRTPTAAVTLSEPGTGFSAAGWIGSRLVLVHGVDNPCVTVLERAS